MIYFELYNPILGAAVLNGVAVLLTAIFLAAAKPKLSPVKATPSKTTSDGNSG